MARWLCEESVTGRFGTAAIPQGGQPFDANIPTVDKSPVRQLSGSIPRGKDCYHKLRLAIVPLLRLLCIDDLEYGRPGSLRRLKGRFSCNMHSPRRLKSTRNV